MAFFHSNFLLQSQNDNQSLPPIPPQDLHGITSLMGKRSSSSFFPEICDGHHQINGGDCPDDELSDDGSQAGEKKRRLNMEQVKTLEKNFELGNKLEPERKMQLARALGLQPRQIAIWFQNRRARWKTKQLEKDYDVLKRKFDAIKADNEKLLAQNQKLHAEIMAARNGEPTESINLNKETEGSSSNRSENTSEIIKLDISSCGPPHPTINRHHLLFPSSSNSNSYHNQSSNSKLEQSGGVVKEENHLCNMFVGMDDQTGFWPWIEHQQFN